MVAQITTEQFIELARSKFGGELYFKETIKNDEAKRALAKERGFYLLELSYTQMENNGIEITLEMALRYNGHVFDESITISKPCGPRRIETFF